MKYYWPTIHDYVKVTSLYGPRISPTTGLKQFHNGVDMIGFSDIYPTCAQEVTEVKYNKDRGWYITAADSAGINHRYQHLKADSIVPNVGGIITRDSPIAKMGRTGDSTGVHLHYECFVGSVYMTPKLILGEAANILGAHALKAKEGVEVKQYVRIYGNPIECTEGSTDWEVLASAIVNGQAVVRCEDGVIVSYAPRMAKEVDQYSGAASVIKELIFNELQEGEIIA